LDGFAVHYNKGFVIVLPSERYLNSDLLWTLIWKQEQKEFSQNRNVVTGWDSIRIDTKVNQGCFVVKLKILVLEAPHRR
jgi:hypothetical protein